MQKVLQLYASTVLSKRSYAKKGDGGARQVLILFVILSLSPLDFWIPGS